MNYRELLLVLVTCCVLPGVVSAQADRSKVKASISEAVNSSDDLYPVRSIRSADNSLVVFSASSAGDLVDLLPQGPFKYRFELYTMDKLELQRTIEPVTNGPVALEDIVYFGGNPIMIASQRRGAENKFKVLWQKFDPRLTRNNAPALELLTVDHLKASRGAALAGDPSAPFGFRTLLSPDGSKLLIQGGQLRTVEKRPIHFFMVVNDKMEVLWHQVMAGDANAERSELLSAVVDNNGICTAWIKNTLVKSEVKEGSLGYTSMVIRMSSEGITESEFKMTGNATPVDVELMIADSGAVFCAGIYGELEGKKEKTPGTFSAMLGKGAMEFKQIGRTKFPSPGKTGEQVPDRMVVSSLLRGADGKFALVCEVAYAYSSVVQSAVGPNTNVTLDVHGDIAAQSFATDGNSEWITMVSRFVNSTTFMLGKPLAMVFGNQLNVLFLDQESNIALRQRGERVEQGVDVKDTRTLVLSFDGKGGYTTKAILASGKDVDFLAGNSVFQAGKDAFILFGQRKLGKGKFAPVRVEFSSDGK